ncbi:Upstream stimulatory factor 2 [Camelus dromedarius]|uniref:Upstream stimulatory factor 2 n=1 Tax=Camelus dromedarius TaxID=9838 RepID=A0A5N4DSX5_CAMDR|nr:Upstream stimulatory factor 2 [Camelus dromedarius]
MAPSARRLSGGLGSFPATPGWGAVVLVWLFLSTLCTAPASAIQVTVSDPYHVVILFQPVTLPCTYQLTTTPTAPIVIWKYKSFCRDRIADAFSPASVDNQLNAQLAAGNPGYNPYVECQDSVRTVRVVATKQGNAVTLGDYYQGRRITITGNADLTFDQTAWGDSGVYYCSVVSAQDLQGNNEAYAELIVLGRTSGVAELLPGFQAGPMEETRSGYRIQANQQDDSMRVLYYMEKELANFDPSRPGPPNGRVERGSSHDKGPEAEEGVELQEGGDGPGAEEQTAVAIASVQQAAFGDHNIQYQFRTENNGGQVTYRVVQVTDGQLDGQGDTAGAVSVVSTAAFAGGQQAVTQAVIQNPFSNGGSPAAEAVSGEARFAYFPASSVGDTTAVSVQTTDQSLQAGGQFYVMMTPQDVLQTGTQRTIAPRTHPYSPKIDGTRTPRDERRRAQHNEVERRRRDKINNWIVQLSKIIPDCNADNSKTGASKGGILSKACDYIRELRQTNQRMQETFKEAERLQMDNELLRQQIEELKNENAVLRAQLQQHNLEMVGESARQ